MTYFVRIIPAKKSEAQTYEWHGIQEMFSSPMMLKMKLMDAFKDKLPPSPDSFQVGYIAKRNMKRGIENELDLTSMYKQVSDGGTITLYCETKSNCTTMRKRKNSDDTEDHEDDVKQAADRLQGIHGDKYDSKQLRLWGRMIVNKQHSSYDDPSDIPIITGGARKVQRRESLSDVVTGAALALAKALNSPAKPHSNPTEQKNPQSGVSPLSKARLSSEYITQLKSLQELRESGVLTEEEFIEQKSFAINSIRSINSGK